MHNKDHLHVRYDSFDFIVGENNLRQSVEILWAKNSNGRLRNGPASTISKS